MKKKLKNLATALSLSTIIFLSSHTLAQPFGVAGKQTAVSSKNDLNFSGIGYWEYLPLSFDPTSSEKYPVLIAIHGRGAGGNGTEEDLEIILQSSNSVPDLIRDGTWLTDFCINESCEKTIVLSPQSYGAFGSDALIEFYNYIKSAYPIDLNRLYVVGQSAGGEGALKMVKAAPDIAAAIMPVAPALAIRDEEQLGRLQDLPVWIHVGYLDNVVSRSSTTITMDNLAGFIPDIETYYPEDKANTGNMNKEDITIRSNGTKWEMHSGEILPPTNLLSTTYYSTNDHNTWARTYTNSDTWDWLFSNIRKDKEKINVYAGSELKRINLLEDSRVRISGSVATSDDTDAVSVEWNALSPTTMVLQDQQSTSTLVDDLVVGTTIFRLSASHINGDWDSEDVTVIIDSLVVNDAIVTTDAGQSSIDITADAFSAAGKVITYDWSKFETSDPISLQNTSSKVLTVSNLEEGVYTLEVAISTEDNLSDEAAIILIVGPEVPFVDADAGADITVYYADDLNIDLTSANSSGAIDAFSWNLVSQSPADNPEPTMYDTGADVINLSGFSVGTYVYELVAEVLDADGSTLVSDTDEVVIIVEALPVVFADAGDDIDVYYEEGLGVALNSTASIGEIGLTTWSLISTESTGNPTPTIDDSNAPIAYLSNLAVGTYVYQLEVAYTDEGGHVISNDLDEISINVIAQITPITITDWIEVEAKDGYAGNSINFYFDQPDCTTCDIDYPSNDTFNFSLNTLDEGIDFESLRIEVVMRYQTRTIYVLPEYVVSVSDSWAHYEVPIVDFGFSDTRLEEGGKVTSVTFKTTGGFGEGSFGLGEISFSGSESPVVWYGEGQDKTYGSETVESSNSEELEIAAIHTLTSEEQDPEQQHWLKLITSNGYVGNSIGFYYDEDRENLHSIDYPNNENLEFAVKAIDEGLNIERLRIEITLQYQTRVVFLGSKYITSEDVDWTYYSIPITDFGFDSWRLEGDVKVSKVIFKTTGGFGIGAFGLDEITFTGTGSPSVWYGEASEFVLGADDNSFFSLSDTSSLNITEIHKTGGADPFDNCGTNCRTTQFETIITNSEVNTLKQIKIFSMTGVLLKTIKTNSESFNLRDFGTNSRFYIRRNIYENGYVDIQKIIVDQH